MFNAESTDGQNTMKLMIENKLVDVVIDSGASCNLISEEIFHFVTGNNAGLLECNKRVYAYTFLEPLQLKGGMVLMSKYHRPTNPCILGLM